MFSLFYLYKSISIKAHEFSIGQIADNLCAARFNPQMVAWMKRLRSGASMPRVLVKFDKDKKDIYHQKKVLGLDHNWTMPPLYGHAQSRCTAPIKFVASAGE